MDLVLDFVLLRVLIRHVILCHARLALDILNQYEAYHDLKLFSLKTCTASFTPLLNYFFSSSFRLLGDLLQGQEPLISAKERKQNAFRCYTPMRR